MIVAFVLFLERVHAVHQPHGAGVFRVRKHIFYPGVAGAANVDEHIRLVYRARVGRRGFIAVRVHAGTDEQRQPIFSAGYLPRPDRNRENPWRQCLFPSLPLRPRNRTRAGRAPTKAKSICAWHLSFQSEFQIQFHSIFVFSILSSYDSSHARSRKTMRLPALRLHPAKGRRETHNLHFPVAQRSIFVQITLCPMNRRVL